jgi:hypothetical protein
MKTKLLIILFFFAGTACKKNKMCDEPELPCQTHEGKNTLGCFIDGVPFVADVKFTIGGPVAVSGEFDEGTNLLIVQGTRGNNDGAIDDVRFRVYITNGVGIYPMHIISASYKGYIDYIGANCFYYHNTANPGNVEITFLDTSKNIIAGTFEMTLTNTDCAESESMVITKGRFDFGY